MGVHLPKLPIRPDGVGKVTGAAVYGADVRLPRTVYGRLLRSPHAHARILSIDTQRALHLPGVLAIISSADLPDPGAAQSDDLSRYYRSRNVLAHDRVLYHGHAVAAVAATSAQIADEALDLIEVKYEPLPHILDVEEAMKAGAPIIHPDLRTTDAVEQREEGHTNIASRTRNTRGDIDEGFAAAAVVVEHELSTAMVHQGYIEPQATTAHYSSDGLLTIWCSTQGPFQVRRQVADLLQIEVSQVRVIPTEIGGGFGGKVTAYIEPVAAILSRRCSHRPVKMVLTRTDVFTGTGPAAGSHVRVKLGADPEGHLIAAEARVIYEAGAFPGSTVDFGATVMFAPYRIANLSTEALSVIVNKPKAFDYRASSSTLAVTAAESAIDKLAEALHTDPLEHRLINAVREGDPGPDGPAYRRIGLIETLEAARAHPHYTAPLEGRCRGRGVAAGILSNMGGLSSASASLNRDGTVNLILGSVDLSGTRLSLAMQLAQVLGIPTEHVHPLSANTESVSFSEGSWGSRTTFATGKIVCELGERMVQELGDHVARMWGLPSDEVAFRNGVFSGDAHQISLGELAARLEDQGISVLLSLSRDPNGCGPSAATHIVDVEVDTDTGKVTVLRYTALQDAGHAVHRDLVEGQIQGGVVQGIGWALSEGYTFDAAGHLSNPGFLDYRMPTCLDVPMVDAVILEIANPGHPLGVRGVGEVPILPPPAAIANAIYRATGLRLSELPMAPERIYQATRDSQPDTPS
jgi:xanthine dehydrogenase molybdenum-binding subunit